ncbi:MAG: AAA family ATPase [Verrucomicrobiales bacterium]|nr:AAA family ATPase [Verrucomicrobiales bacterium]
MPRSNASQLDSRGPQTQWLVEELWGDQAVGILGGEPKCCKSFLALDLAVSVASGAACAPVPRPAPGAVLLFPPRTPAHRAAALKASPPRPKSFASLPVQVITAPTLRLDTATDRERLAHRPETTADPPDPGSAHPPPPRRGNDATRSPRSSPASPAPAPVPSGRPGRSPRPQGRPRCSRPALRGSSELHGWGDSNLYLRRQGSQLTLVTEHRAAPSRDPIPSTGRLQDHLAAPGPRQPRRRWAHPLSACAAWPNSTNRCPFSNSRNAVAAHRHRVFGPGPTRRSRRVLRHTQGYQLKLPCLSAYTAPGNGSRQHVLCSSGG